jgi:hypothetical protein
MEVPRGPSGTAGATMRRTSMTTLTGRAGIEAEPRIWGEFEEAEEETG